MKKIFIIPFLFFTIISFSQTIEQDEVDEFNGTIKRKTSWERLVYTLASFNTSYFRISSYNTSMFFELRMMGTGVISIPEGSDLILKLDDGATCTLHALDYVIASKGGGSTGLAGSNTFGFIQRYILTDDDIDVLTEKKPVKMRVYLRDSYLENDINEKNANRIAPSIRLVHDKVKKEKANQVNSTIDGMVKVFKDSKIENAEKDNKQVDKYDKLKKLKSLLDEGIITQEEFDMEKKKILSE